MYFLHYNCIFTLGPTTPSLVKPSPTKWKGKIEDDVRQTTAEDFPMITFIAPDDLKPHTLLPYHQREVIGHFTIGQMTNKITLHILRS